jgi:hypothetical protein
VKRIVYPPLQPNGAQTGAACFGCGEIAQKPASALRSKARKDAIMVIIENADQRDAITRSPARGAATFRTIAMLRTAVDES